MKTILKAMWLAIVVFFTSRYAPMYITTDMVSEYSDKLNAPLGGLLKIDLNNYK